MSCLGPARGLYNSDCLPCLCQDVHKQMGRLFIQSLKLSSAICPSVWNSELPLVQEFPNLFNRWLPWLLGHWLWFLHTDVYATILHIRAAWTLLGGSMQGSDNPIHLLSRPYHVTTMWLILLVDRQDPLGSCKGNRWTKTRSEGRKVRNWKVGA